LVSKAVSHSLDGVPQAIDEWNQMNS
jgi:hypothetical protein